MTIHLTESATLHPLLLPAGADAAPTDEIRAYADVRNRSLLETTGRDDDALSAAALLPVLYSSRASRKRQWFVMDAGEMVGCMAVDMLQDASADTAIAVIALLRSHWRQGIGTAALAVLETELRAAGVRALLGWAEHHGDQTNSLHSPTGFGAVPRDATAEFLENRGFALEQVERASELVWSAETHTRLTRSLNVAQEHARDYRVVQWVLPTPPEFVDGYAWMKSRMSTDVPDAELGIPEEVWDAERVAELEQRQAAKGFTIQVTAAEHIAGGELCAFNELAINLCEPAGTTHQYDTLVLAGHRGHRLGTLVKTAGLLRWHDRYPQSPRVITYNAEENRPMLSINETIGFAPMSYEGAWKKDLT
ncbi:GNAT family N-acetyltransferase [Microbacterium sp. A196]|uniref:GNAT family N-acetyltransferase n=1 Tax=unclassified Microbacterium TaxID=2609290 RepID=UPI003FD1E5F0